MEIERDAINLGEERIPSLFRRYLLPTLFGMLSLCAVTTTDGIFVGRGVGSDALAAVNICIAPTMLVMGIALMLGIGSSVISSIRLASGDVKAAKLNITQALAVCTLIVAAFLLITLFRPELTGRILGSSPTLMPLVLDYMPFVFAACMFQAWCGIGLFVVRLDGSPKYAMWCNVIPGLLNVILDYIFIFPLNMGVRGAALATFLSCMTGGIMDLSYICFFARTLGLCPVGFNPAALRLMARNIARQCRIGVSALLGEATMGVLMLTGNIVFMYYIGDTGVGAFSITCYYCPFVFMIGNAIAQSAQPIISYNYGLGSRARVIATEKLAIYTAVACGLLVTLAFSLYPSAMVGLFLDSHAPAAQIAVAGFPFFSAAFVFFIFNLTAIGYFQSIEKALPSVVFALLRGLVFLVPAFVIMPEVLGLRGIWLALFVSEALTSLSIIGYVLASRRPRK